MCRIDAATSRGIRFPRPSWRRVNGTPAVRNGASVGLGHLSVHRARCTDPATQVHVPCRGVPLLSVPPRAGARIFGSHNRSLYAVNA